MNYPAGITAYSTSRKGGTGYDKAANKRPGDPSADISLEGAGGRQVRTDSNNGTDILLDQKANWHRPGCGARAVKSDCSGKVISSPATDAGTKGGIRFPANTDDSGLAG